jgi:peptidoglycan hydrolase-like protein with peptidoglycan-binding domain
MTGAVRFPVIPETVTVHLGRPDADARNVTVSFADYIKNVASSEIYPTWPESALAANIYAQISFALNRIYTEYYPSRGYDFDITNSTAIDQSFVYGRDIFENVSRLTDEIFNSYIRRRGAVQPLFALYCDGIEVQCGGLSQWGSVELARAGLSPFEILQYYYGDDIEIVSDVPVEGIGESYPGRPLAPESFGDEVYLLQVRLNRISKNYPGIPKIARIDGVYSAETADAVEAFQRQFGLTPDGVTGRATWYAIARIYAAVKRLSDVNSEGVPPEDAALLFDDQLSEGLRGNEVRELQYLLLFVSQFDEAVRPVEIDGIFGPQTRSAVEDFQRDAGLRVTGSVDRTTGELLYRRYVIYRDSLPEDYFPVTTKPYPGAPLRQGSRGEDVALLQGWLNRIGEVNGALPRLTVDGIYGARTAEAVRMWQRIAGLDPTGATASYTWESIASAYRALTEGEYGSADQFGGPVGIGG